VPSPASDRRRIAVTGLGSVCALGSGVPAFWDALVHGRSGVGRLTCFDEDPFPVPIGGQAWDFDPSQHVAEGQLDLLDRCTLFALAAAEEARRDAGLDLPVAAPDRIGVAIGTALGGAVSEDRAFHRLYSEKRRTHPLTIPRIMYSAPASHVTMALGIQGPTICVSTACASGTQAIGEAAEMIRAGRADVMLAGGADAPLSFGVMKAWEAMRVLAPAGDDAAAACRPFSRDRRGLVLGEGAGMVVLEDWAHATRRGARIYAELAGYGATADARHITHPGLEAPARAIVLALRQAGLAPAEVGYVNAHGSATVVNDAAETAVLKRVFGDHASRLLVSGTKSMHGHAMGASGALEMIACVLALVHDIIPPTANYTEPDPECDLDCVPCVARPARVDATISNSFAFGGLNAVLAITRVHAPGV
jgi:nodulation protein E